MITYFCLASDGPCACMSVISQRVTGLPLLPDDAIKEIFFSSSALTRQGGEEEWKFNHGGLGVDLPVNGLKILH